MCDIVYHYTSPDGILGILKNKTLRFTDCQYLNDIGELAYMKEPFKTAYERIDKERSENNSNSARFIDDLFESPYEKIDFKHTGKKLTPTNNRYYLLCTSLNHDTANMWNYYVKNSVYQGYNLGINKDVMVKHFNSYRIKYYNQIEIFHGQVIYDRHIQENMIYNKLKELRKKYDREAEKADDHWTDVAIDNYQDELYRYIQKQQFFFKHPAFASEQEYRFIIKVDNDFDFSQEPDLKLDFRIGQSGIITPYIEWQYDQNKKEELFSQITLAPMIEPTLAMESFKRFLASTVQERIEIKPSSIKLRF